MPIDIKGKSDSALEEIRTALQPYLDEHPSADIVLYRQNSVSVRIRIVDSAFRGVSKADRHDLLWKLIENLPEESQQDVSVLLLLTPEETKASLMSLEFEDPAPSRL